MRPLADIEADVAMGRRGDHWSVLDRSYRLACDVPQLLAALEQARSIAVRLEQEVAANAEPF
jgi:hypothetical protein